RNERSSDWRRGAASSPDPDALPGNNLASSPDPAAHEPDPDSFNGEAILFFPMSLALRDEFLLDPEVVFLNHGSFGATPRPVFERTWTFVGEHRQAQLKVQKLPKPMTDPDEVVEAIWAGVTPRTRVLFLSHITSPTAVILPIEPLIARAREAGIWTVIDGAHAPGQVELDLTQMGVDFYGGNCHKWLSAPKGAGFLYVRPALQQLIEPVVVSWGWRPKDPGPAVFVDQIERQATHDPPAYLSVPAAIHFQAQRDWP